MDSIYRNSEATVITAAGEGPSYGLPGFGDRHRRKQFRFQIGKHCFVGPMRFMDKVVDNCRWGTRGWTFQEGMLSRRRLVFTDDQVYFECGGMYCYEAIDLPLEKLHDKARQAFDDNCIHATDERRMGVWQTNDSKSSDIYEQIRRYSERKFTKLSDRLNGFYGMLNESNALRSIRHLWGIPIPPDEEFDENGETQLKYSSASFVKGLLFQMPPPITATRIPNLPSWSWTGWDVAVLYEDFLRYYNPSPSTMVVSIELEKVESEKDGQLLEWDEFHANRYDKLNERYGELNDYPKLSPFLHVSAPVALAYVDKDRTPKGDIQCKFYLDNGYYLRADLKDVVVDCTGDVCHGIIWANGDDHEFVILTKEVEEEFMRIGIIMSLGSDSSDLMTLDHQRICSGSEMDYYFQFYFQEDWLDHLEMKHMNIRLI